MEEVKAYLRRCSMRRVLVMLFGVVLTGVGIAIFRMSTLGTDPYNGMNMALAEQFHVSYPTVQLLMNLVLFGIQILWGRSLLGLGTIVNAFGLAYVVAFFYDVFLKIMPLSENLPIRIVILLVGLVICSLGLSMYQKADLGVAPYDALALILTQRIKNSPFFVWRVLVDGSCALICFLAGGVKIAVLGLGTVVVAFGFGPVIQFFDHSVTRHLINDQESR